MIDKLKNLKLDLLLKELKLLDSEQNYYEEFTNHYRTIFMDELTKNGYIPNTQTGNTTQQIQEPQTKKTMDVGEDDLKLIKTTFRSIAKVSHPDKTKNQYKNKLYEQAQIAYEINDLLTLYKISKKLHIDIDLSTTTFSLLEKIIDDKKKEMGNIKNSFLWLWVNSETEEQKNEIINQFLNKHGKK